MSLTSVLGFVFSFRLLAATLLIWILFSTQSMAWQQVSYNTYPGYTAPINYNPYAQPNRYPRVNTPRYYNPGYNYPAYNYPRYNYQQPRYRTPLIQPARPVESIKQPDIKKVLNAKPQKAVIEKNIRPSKQLFIGNLLPYIDKENQRIKQLRKRALITIQQLDSDVSISHSSKIWLKKLAKKYRIKGNPIDNQQAREAILTKVDIIPSSLTLAQAANESAWGTSRFATEANNLFGIWTYDKSKGLKPKNRDTEKKHLVRIFDHYGESVSYYMHTLNSHPAYKKLRDIRQQQRARQTAIDGLEMANGLEKYSAKGDLYIKLIRDLIRQNQWAQLDIINQSV